MPKTIGTNISLLYLNFFRHISIAKRKTRWLELSPLLPICKGRGGCGAGWWLGNFIKPIIIWQCRFSWKTAEKIVEEKGVKVRNGYTFFLNEEFSPIEMFNLSFLKSQVMCKGRDTKKCFFLVVGREGKPPWPLSKKIGKKRKKLSKSVSGYLRRKKSGMNH